MTALGGILKEAPDLASLSSSSGKDTPRAGLLTCSSAFRSQEDLVNMQILVLWVGVGPETLHF